MASIAKRGDSYRITAYGGRKYDGSQIKETITFKPDPNKTKKQNERDLKKFAAEFEEKVRSGNYLSGSKMKLSDYSKMWLENYAKPTMEITSYERAEDIFRVNILPRLGNMKIGDIKPVTLLGFYEDLSTTGYVKNGAHKSYAPSTIDRIHRTLSSALRCAVEWQLLERNPCDRVKPPRKKTKPKVKHMKRDQTEIFLEALSEPYEVVYRGRKHKDGTPSAEHRELRTVPFQLQVFFRMALTCGMRRGELAELTWDTIDYSKGIITVEKAAAGTRSGQITKVPKNSSSFRKLAVPKEIIDDLKKLRLEQEKYKLSVGTYWTDHGYLFTQDNGAQISLDWPNRVFKQIIARHNASCENPEELLPEDITLHGLRHTSASILIADGVDINTVSHFLGHAETSTTLNIYTHELEDVSEAIPDVFDRLFTNSSPNSKKEAASK